MFERPSRVYASALAIAYHIIFYSLSASAKKNKTVHIVFSNHLVCLDYTSQGCLLMAAWLTHQHYKALQIV